MLLLPWLDQKSAETGLQRLAPVERRAALEQLSGAARWDPETILVYSWHHVEENSTCRDLPWCMVPWMVLKITNLAFWGQALLRFMTKAGCSDAVSQISVRKKNLPGSLRSASTALSQWSLCRQQVEMEMACSVAVDLQRKILRTKVSFEFQQWVRLKENLRFTLHILLSLVISFPVKTFLLLLFSCKKLFF